MADFFNNMLEERGTVLLDCALGTSMMAAGVVRAGERTDKPNLTHPDVVLGHYRSNIAAGADILKANTFGIGLLKADEAKDGYNNMDALRAGLRLARQAAEEGGVGGKRIYVEFDLGPLGELVGFTDGLEHDRARELFAGAVRAAMEEAPDLMNIETMSDIEEVKDALWAIRTYAPGLPVSCSMTFDAGGHTFMGATPAMFAEAMRDLDLDAIGMNCSIGPDEMAGIFPELIEAAGGTPVFAKPNAGLPKVVDGKAVYEMTPESFTAGMKKILDQGVRIVGGCCGTTPEMIAALGRMIGKI
ncbi:MAG: homocysteine S-methyltransferase family protein [Clostridiales Family XIII bacterium]|jgi:5-methyltetrahydrofolate--homocysteine methyltransferase|nr:homocysteine S-methyltransferase family protein [Clostridiales Family XIII bacterium]